MTPVKRTCDICKKLIYVGPGALTYSTGNNEVCKECYEKSLIMVSPDDYKTCIECGKHFDNMLSIEDGNSICIGCFKKVTGQTDKPESPDHYKTGGIETIDYMRAKMTSEQFEGYCLGNVIKYVSRYRDKNGVEDLNKASVYLNWLIETVERK